jgi:uncharacterized protein YuzE
MNIRYDRSVDAAYISLLSERDPHMQFGFTYACDPAEVNGQIHLDFDTAGRLIGIEVLQASKMLPLALLRSTNEN